MDLARVTAVVNIIASAAVVSRMVYCRLFRTYKFLFAFMVADLLFGATLFASPYHTNLYAYVYMAGTAAELFLAIAVVTELFAGALAEHPALAKFGSRAVGYILIGAGIFSAALLGVDEFVPRGQSALLHRYFRAERTVELGVVLFLAVISIFLIWFPVRVKKNLAYYLGGFGISYAARSAGLLAINTLFASHQPLVDGVMMWISIACLMGFAMRLQKESATTADLVQRRPSLEAEHLTRQLASINSTLARLGKR